MDYLTEQEYEELGFKCVDSFSSAIIYAQHAIDLYTNHFYHYHSLETDIEPRRRAVKLAVAYQVAYIDESGIKTAESKQMASSVQIGRTSISYSKGSGETFGANPYNLSLDALNWLRIAGFGYAGVCYDR